ncbi:MAG TPA: GNAT family N-acetyltransferase [Pyrinomonadaceae bacterium]|nr:GNAT family N-acetyltransferase [Pyrinomonadaceae bacterium]
MDFILETERLTLREWAADDADALFAMASDAEVMRYVGDGKPWVDIARAREWLGWMRDCYRQHGYGRWCVVEKDGRRVVGSCGFWPMAETNEVDFGYLLARDRWGRGYASEVGRAVLRHGFVRLGFAEVVARVEPSNTASRRVLEKLGFVCRGPKSYSGYDPGEFASYVLKRADFDARAARRVGARETESDAG